MKLFNTDNIHLLKKSLDLYAKEHSAIAKNIANANNPNYKRVNTDFSKVLRSNLERTLKTTDPRHISEPEIPERKNQNDAHSEVDISQEMGQLAENQIRYEFASKALNRTYRMLLSGITGRQT